MPALRPTRGRASRSEAPHERTTRQREHLPDRQDHHRRDQAGRLPVDGDLARRLGVDRERTERRRRNAAGLSERLRGVEGLVLPTELPNRRHVWHQYTVRITADARIDRDGVIDGLGAAGIGCGIYYPKAAYDYDCYRGHRRVVGASCPEAERAAREVLSLPVHPSLTDSDLDRIAAAVHALLGDPA